MRVAVTGATGRLGRAVVTALEEAPFTGPFGPIGWSRTIFDLDAPDMAGALLDRDRPEVVVHCAAWKVSNTTSAFLNRLSLKAPRNCVMQSGAKRRVFRSPN